MSFGRRMNRLRVALGVVLAIGVAVTAGAQTPPGAATGDLYTPAKDAKDLRAVLFNWMWHQGMLKGTDERDMVGTLEYQGKGTIQVDGQPCTLTKFRASTNYQTLSQRIQYRLHASQRAEGTRTSKWSAACTPGTKTSRAPKSVRPKARRSRWRMRCRTG